MPFDGLGYSPSPAKPSALGRLLQFFQRSTPTVETQPIRAFQPVPTQPEAIPLQVLTIGKALIEDRKDWVQRRYETRDGRRCAVGAIRGAARLMNLHGPLTGANAIMLSVAMSRGFNDIESLNDNSSHRQVLSAFDEAISRSRANMRQS